MMMRMMRRMSWTRTGWTVTGLGMAMFLAPGLEAQSGERGMRDRARMTDRDRRVGQVERVLGLREELGLEEAQVAALNEVRLEALSERLAARQSEAEFQSRLRSERSAGEISRAEARERLEAHRAEAREFREEARDRAEARRERVEGILTDAQREELSELTRRRSARRGAARRPGRLRGGPPGLRSGRGLRGIDGARLQRSRVRPFGPGFGPRGRRPLD